MQADETLAFGGEFLDRTNLIGASDAAQESTGASRHIPAHQTASAFNSPFKARSAVRRFVIETGLVVVKLIALAEALRRKIRHHDVCSGFYAEFTSNVHEVTPEYLADIESEKPLRQTLARELWLQTEHLWTQFPGFIEALRNH